MRFLYFPSKQTRASEFEGVLKPGGRVGITDIINHGTTLPGLEGLLAWIALDRRRQPLQRYAGWLSAAGLHIIHAEPRSHCLQEMVQGIRSKLLVSEIMIALKKISLLVWI